LGALPRNEAPLRLNRALVKHVTGADPSALAQSGLHEFLDQLQGELAKLHAMIQSTWFRLAD